MNKAGYISFKTNPEVARQLENLRQFYGVSTRQKLMMNIVIDAVILTAKYGLRTMTENPTAEQKRAHKRIVKYIDSFKTKRERNLAIQKRLYLQAQKEYLESGDE